MGNNPTFCFRGSDGLVCQDAVAPKSLHMGFHRTAKVKFLHIRAGGVGIG